MKNPTEFNEDQRPAARKIPKIPTRKYGFFRDDQITCLVTHAGDKVTDDQLEAFRERMNSALSKQSPYPGEIEKLPEVITFSNLANKNEQNQLLNENQTIRGAFSIIRCWIQNPLLDPLEHLSLIEKLDSQLKENSNVEFNNNGLNNDGLNILGVSLNWITSVASQGSGTGGPGGTPTPYYGSRKNAPYTFDLQRKLEDCGIYGNGRDVDVVILDTAPSAHELVAAYKEWPDHPLIATLLGPDGKLQLYPTDYAATQRLGNLSLNDSDYRMTDHGLFIAGIIHSVVPEAKIHLVEVLNQNGVGDYIAFYAGMQKALNEIYDPIRYPNRKMVINCSWMLDFPTDDHHCRHIKNPGAILNDPDLEFERQVREFVKRNMQTTALMLEASFATSDQIGRGAIAAAGNDAYDESNSNHIRPLARYPAGLTPVHGVGALPTTLDKFGSGTHRGKYKASGFSNRAEREDPTGQHPPEFGFATLGGEPGEGKGILGLYIGEFPDGRQNTSKWAWWAGTSFATPLVTAAVASVLSNTKQPVATTKEAIDLVRQNLVDGSTDVDEEAIPIIQC